MSVLTVYGEISKEFNVDNLKNLCMPSDGIQTGPFGSQLHKEDYVTIGTPIITVEHLGDNRIIHDNLPKVSDADKERLKKYHLKKGDIVFSRVGSVDRRALVRDIEDGWLFSGRCLRVRSNPNVLDPTFLSYFFGFQGFQEYINKIAVGATMPSINTKILADIPIYFPPLPEQHAIAHILGSLDDKIEANRRQNETLEATARAIFKSWFVDFDPVHAKARGEHPHGMDAETAALFPAEFEESELGLVPRGWGVGTLGDIADITSGKRPKHRYESRSLKAQIPLYGGAGIMAYVETPLYTESILLTGRVGTLGKVFKVTEPSWPSDNTVIIQPYDGKWIDYVYCLLLGIDFLSMNRGSTQPLVAQKDIKNVKVTRASLEVIESFSKIVKSLMLMTDENIRQSRTLAETRDALLPRLVSGEWRVGDFEIKGI